MSGLDPSEKMQAEAVDVVLVDDDRLTLDIVSWNLRHSPVSYKFFQHPEQAMGYLACTTPRILIVDFYMPLINGMEFLEELSNKRDLGSCMIYLCSAVATSPQYVEKLHDIGATVLEKDQLCDKTGILKLVDLLPNVTVNGATQPLQIGSAVASPENGRQAFSAENTQLYKN